MRHLPICCLLMLPFLILTCQDARNTDISGFEDSFTPLLTDDRIDEWDGNMDYWQFEEGVLTGETTPNNILIENTFLIWEGRTGENFELKTEYRISKRGNSGINYHSKIVENKDYVLAGFQADIDGLNKYTGQLYEEKGRGTLSKRGQIIMLGEDKKPLEIATTGIAEHLFSVINSDSSAWNKLHIIAKDDVVIHLINGEIMSLTFDNGNRSSRGNTLGLQLHLGPPMKVEFRNLLLKHLP